MLSSKSYDPTSHWSTLTDEQKLQLEQQQALWKYYKGEFKSHLKPKILPNGSTIDDNVSIALARRIVNKTNNFLFGKGVSWQLDETKHTIEEDVLSDIWGNDETQSALLTELGINGSVSGTFYLQILSEPIKVKLLNPQWVFPTPNPANVDEALAYDLRWQNGKDVYRLLHTRLNDDSWDFVKQKWHRQSWVNDSETRKWEFPWPFVVHGKNLPNPNVFYGLSDLEDIQLNDTINQVSSNLNRIIRIFAHPLIWGVGFGSNSLDVDVSKLITTTNENGKLQALELGRDLSDAQEYLKFLRTMLAETTAVPEADPDRLKIGAQSGFSLEVLLNDLLLKTGIKRNFYGKALIETNRRLLDLAGFGDDNNTKLYWNQPLPRDHATETMSDTFDLQSGIVSKKTLATKRGYDFDFEMEQLRLEQTNTSTLGEALITAFRSGG